FFGLVQLAPGSDAALDVLLTMGIGLSEELPDLGGPGLDLTVIPDHRPVGVQHLDLALRHRHRGHAHLVFTLDSRDLEAHSFSSPSSVNFSSSSSASCSGGQCCRSAT